jgi:hypothetical protein
LFAFGQRKVDQFSLVDGLLRMAFRTSQRACLQLYAL